MYVYVIYYEQALKLQIVKVDNHQQRANIELSDVLMLILTRVNFRLRNQTLQPKPLLSPKIAIFTTFFVSPGAITLNVVWMEREFDAYKLSRCMCPSNYYRF